MPPAWKRRLAKVTGAEGAVGAIAAAILCLPCLGIGYVWDDFIFLSLNGTGDPRTYLIPQQSAVFYRPISQGLYFLLLRTVDPLSGWLGHWINLLLLAASVFLLATLTSRLFGRQAGLVAGVYFASMGAVPGLVAWISCCQDLFALVFLLTALWLRERGANGWALASFAAALLSKEVVVAFAPALILWDWFRGRKPGHVLRQTAWYGALVAAWAVIHPGIRTLAAHGFQSGATQYVGLERPDRWVRYFVRYAATLADLPITGRSTPWPADRTPYAIAALALVGAWILLIRPVDSGPGNRMRASLKRPLLLASLLTFPPMLMPALLVRYWAPYYVCVAAVGVAVLLGYALRKCAPRVLAAVLAAALLLGTWSRGMVIGTEPTLTEAMCVVSAHSGAQVEANFKRLHPSFPRGAQVLVSVTSTGIRGIHFMMLETQALRAWYRNDPLITLRPEQRRCVAPAEYLFRIRSSLDVVEIDPVAFRFYNTGSEPPLPSEVNRSLRAYARGLAACGRTDEAVSILTRLSRFESGLERAYDERLVAMVLLAAGREAAADSALRLSPPFARDVALEIVKKIYAEPTKSGVLDSLAFRAFGLSARDPGALRYLMRQFLEEKRERQALEFAVRLQRAVPGDQEARRVVKEIGSRR